MWSQKYARTIIPYSLLLLLTLAGCSSVSIAQKTTDFAKEGCSQFFQLKYYRTESYHVNICQDTIGQFMVVSDSAGGRRDQVPIRQQGDRYEGTSTTGTFYSIDNSTFTIRSSNAGQGPVYERVLQIIDGNNNNAQTGEVSGTVSYRQRIALAPNATIEVTLRDVSRNDTSGAIVTQQSISANGRQVPISYRLSYSSNQINPNNSYAIDAVIVENGQVRWRNTQRYRVITGGYPTSNVEIVVDPVQSTPPPQQTGQVTGSITYLQRVALATNAIVQVTLQDASLRNAPKVNINRQTISTNGRQVPIPFQLIYNQNQINPNRIYEIDARIFENGQLTWTNRTQYPVITQGNPSSVEVIVSPVDRNPASPGPNPPALW